MLTHILATCLSLVAFLSGLRLMRSGFERMAEGRLARVIRVAASTPTRGILTGAVSTALLQSSGAVTAITVGLVAAGSLDFASGLGLVLGANVGTTITPQLLHLNLWGIVLPALALGLALSLSPRRAHRPLGEGLVGFASLFIALQALSAALRPVAAAPFFHRALATAGQHALLAALAGAALSALVQSSTATTLIAMALASQHSIPLEGAVAIALGANVGTCLTSVIAAIGTPRPAQRIALAHVLLNAVGVAVCLPLLHPFTSAIALASATPGQAVANANTAFNALSTLAVWPLTRPFARLLVWMLPDARAA
ncbi:Na/Pi cotransporter family protein [Alicyclobacillus vulcanalis]|uniref:Phosphate:Na+ symporter n=1 Tax=Alicyclobacillus vulcanalis TaxID=252246 RepID=A0A1N7KZ60_9BACL|nr:Na/Pi symporter [Alicyclobacillus vulcanalis]SIS66796.1 phosphate:Na+ symporter [Alicyclobacillus vulcanalis]